MVIFHQFACSKTNRNLCCPCMIFDQMNNTVEASVYGTIMVCLITEILTKRTFLIMSHMNSMFDKFINSLIFCRGNWNDRHSKLIFHAVNIDVSTIVIHFIHHIKSYNHWDIHLQKLHGQIKITFNVSRINNINNSTWLFVQNKITGNNLFTCIR